MIEGVLNGLLLELMSDPISGDYDTSALQVECGLRKLGIEYRVCEFGVQCESDGGPERKENPVLQLRVGKNENEPPKTRMCQVVERPASKTWHMT